MAYSRIKCPRCNEDFGQESRFFRHLLESHDIIDPEKLFVDEFCDGVYPTCQCRIECSAPLHWAGWKKGFTSKFVRGYNESSFMTLALVDVSDTIWAGMALEISFNDHHGNSLEVTRCCTRLDTCVTGWLCRLSEAALDVGISMGKDSLVMSVDNRFKDDNELRGWNYVDESSQDFWWTDFAHRYDVMSDGRAQIFGRSSSTWKFC